MSRFNTRTARPAVSSPVTTTASAATHEGGAGYQRDPKGELFLLAVSNLVGQHTLYESGPDRDSRFQSLVRQLAVDDPDWTAGFLVWLRGSANMRTAAVVGAAEFVKARLGAAAGRSERERPAAVNALDARGPERRVIDAVLQRADEPGELLGYWVSRYGRAVPKPIKRGIADAVRRLYSPRALLKYDVPSKGYRFGDILNLVHATPDPAKPWQGALFTYALDRRHNPDTAVPPDACPMLLAHQKLMRVPPALRRKVITAPSGADRLASAGVTWEALAGWLQGPMDRAAWETVIPSMGIMALLRNLRNFDQAGVSDAVAAQVAARISDPDEVAKSRQFPFRFHTAYREAPSLRWGHALDKALTASLDNVPALRGRTLILIDTSASMRDVLSRDSSVRRWDVATLFGVALAHRCDSAQVVSYSAGGWGVRRRTKAFPMVRGESVLRSIERWKRDGFFLGGGTETAMALRDTFDGHDRVVIVTDEQTADSGASMQIPASVPLYTWNLAGYRVGHSPSGSGNRHTFGGLTDAAFRLIPLLEAGHTAAWPWE
ncbi:TROVE domain-containing protein [Streptomyces sp. AD55]|uniref:TROVE domain-containing protein n=1 Tax=Streptomyces sp. AD55 TaxID=3242895 RepID=UPI00352989A9